MNDVRVAVQEYVPQSACRGQRTISGVSSLASLRAHWIKLKLSQGYTQRTPPTDSFSPVPNCLGFKQKLTIYCCPFVISFLSFYDIGS